MPNSEIFSSTPKIKQKFTFRKYGLVLGILLVSVIVTVAIMILAFPNRKVKNTFVLKDYTTAAVKVQDIVSQIQVTGVVEFENITYLLAPAPSVIRAVYKSTGDAVKKGELIEVLQSESLEDSLVQKQNSLFSYEQTLKQKKIDHEYAIKLYYYEQTLLERNLDTAKKEYEKTKELFTAQLVSSDDLRAAETKMRNAEDALTKSKLQEQQEQQNFELTIETLTASINTIKAEIALLQNKLASLTIISPLSGIVISRNYSVGYSVSQYAELAAVADVSKILARLDVPENQAGLLKPGMKVYLEINSRAFEGIIDRISPVADTSSSNTSATIRTYVRITNGNELVPQGSTVTAVIPLGKQTSALVLPRGAYLVSGSYAYVYVVKGLKAYKTPVTFGTITDAIVEVKKGLAHGDIVITSGYQDFIDKESIELAGKE